MNKYEYLLETHVFDEEDLKLIKELIERATPKKTLNTKYVLYNDKLVECPICGKSDLKAKFCRHCGQALIKVKSYE